MGLVLRSLFESKMSCIRLNLGRFVADFICRVK